jgi:hypothetical protein
MRSLYVILDRGSCVGYHASNSAAMKRLGSRWRTSSEYDRPRAPEVDMATLEEDVDRLNAYDGWRANAGAMRDEACAVLLQSLENPGDKPATVVWRKLDDEYVLERAEVLKALLKYRGDKKQVKEKIKRLSEELDKLPCAQAVAGGTNGMLVLRSATAMSALAASPDSAFSKPVMYFLYCIVREIYHAQPPDWSVGGAGAGGGAASNGFVTWRCVRAIKDFKQALTQTARLIREIRTLIASNEQFRAAYSGSSKVTRPAPLQAPLRAWEEVDATRLAQSFLTAANTLNDNIALQMKSLASLDGGDGSIGERLAPFVNGIRAELKAEIDDHQRVFTEAADLLDEYRCVENDRGKTDRGVLFANRRSETAHTLALLTVKDAAEYAAKAARCFRATGPAVAELEDVAETFDTAARHFDELLDTVKAHVSRVLDTQLAAAALPGPGFGWDASEMAFSAAAYAEVSQWPEQRVGRAAQHLLALMDESGGFPRGRPIHTSEEGHSVHAFNSDVLHALALVLEKTPEVEFQAAHAERMLAYFRDAQTKRGTYLTKDSHGPQSRRQTASAALALAAINCMLDERINALVFRHFSVKRPDQIKIPGLRDLFYSDYGLAHFSGTAEARAHPAVSRKQSVAVLLERMRAHVRGVGDPAARSFSLVLHGPPGTGKTTLVESLAKSSEVPLVEVTPSDIVVGGAEAVERRARAVFTALSLLTRAVILFDEFDPVILRRNPEDKNPSVFSFLTPGMLPKLKTLHDRAERRSVCYVLVTNLVAKLDEAAIRGGRFDDRVGLYPPDLLSRIGRLYRAVEKFAEERRRHAKATGASEPADLFTDPEFLPRFWKVVSSTRGGSMNTLAKPGWFTDPKIDGLGAGNAFSYLFGAEPESAPPDPLAEAKLGLPVVPQDHHEHCPPANGEREGTVDRKTQEGRTREESPATREFKEWAWVVEVEKEWASKGPSDSAEPTGGTADITQCGKNAALKVDGLYCAAVKKALGGGHAGTQVIEIWLTRVPNASTSGRFDRADPDAEKAPSHEPT